MDADSPAPPPPPPPAPPPPEPEAKKRRSSTLIWGIVAGVVLVALIVVFAVTRGGGDDGGDAATFDDDAYPFTFEYPGDWTLSDDVSLGKELGGSGLDKRAVSIDSSNAIILERFELNIPIDKDNLNLAKRELDGLLITVDPLATGVEGETGGYPSITYDSVTVPQPAGAESKLVALFDGDQEYLLNCQSTEEHRDELTAGCKQALDTLKPK